MSSRGSKLLIEDILASAKKIQRYTAGMTFEQFTLDEKTADAVARNFEIIGEAANRLPEEFKKRYSNIDWDRIRGFFVGGVVTGITSLSVITSIATMRPQSLQTGI